MATERREPTPLDPASLVAFRVLAGGLFAVSALRFLARGWVHHYFVEPTFFFSYWGLGWLRPLPAPGMYLVYGAMFVAAGGVALGLFYRVCAAVFFVAFSYAHLCDVTNYLNHYHLVSLLALVLAVAPLHRAGSIDARRRPAIARLAIPRWALVALRFQVGIVYVFGGIAKLGSDWLVHAQPLTIWLAAHGDWPLVGPLLRAKATAYAASWLGAAFDLAIVPALLARRTRRYAYAAAVLFHVATAALLPIGMFPWFMVTFATVFLPEDWPRRVLPTGLVARVLGEPPTASPAGASANSRLRCALAVAAVVEIAVPLRFLLYPGNVTWTEQGFRFAWKVMVMEKNGDVDFRVTDPETGRTWTLDGRGELTARQRRMMATQPDLILAYAHHLAERFARDGIPDVAVRADAFVSLNGRPAARLVDPDVDLARASDGLAPKVWIGPAPPEPPPF